MRTRLLLLSLALTGLLSACRGGPTDPAELLVLHVAPERVECVGVEPQTCLLIRSEQGGEWELFYDRIEGFTHEPGYRYTLLVERSEVRNPPQDGSSYRWRLVRVVERERA